MKATPLLFVALFAVGCESDRGGTRHTTAADAGRGGAESWRSQDQHRPAGQSRTPRSWRTSRRAWRNTPTLHKDLAKGAAKQKEDTNAEQINAQKTALAAKIQAARADAKQGDIFTPEIRPVFRRLLAPELKGEDGRDAKAILKDDAPAPGTVPFKVNAKYPENQPKPTMPANLLLNLPPLPEPLEYRVVGQHLLLLDTAADLIVDYILNVITT